MTFDRVLVENYKRYRINYTGSRSDYEINDKRPYILALDSDYSFDGRGASILGVNLNYFNGNINDLINDINKNDNDAGFKNFDIKLSFKNKFSKDKESVKDWAAGEKKKRYQNFIKEFPHLGKFIRRYKVSAVTSKKRAIKK